MKASAILKKVRKLPAKEAKQLIESELSKSYDAGYSAGHEQQMKMRIMDAQDSAMKESCNIFKDRP